MEKKRAANGVNINPAIGKARLTIQRDYAISIGDATLLENANKALAYYDPPAPAEVPGETEADRMMRVNERNRHANRDEIRKAEAKNQEERRKLAAALKRGDVDVKVDPSARVKTMTRLKYDQYVPCPFLRRPSLTDEAVPGSLVATRPPVQARPWLALPHLALRPTHRELPDLWPRPLRASRRPSLRRCSSSSKPTWR